MPAISFALFMTVAVAVAVTSCGGDKAEPAPPASTPRELLASLIEGQAPFALARTAKNCTYSSQATDIWKAACSGRTFIVNVRSSLVTPGDARTKRLWDFYAKSGGSGGSTVVEVPTVSQRSLDEAACRA